MTIREDDSGRSRELTGPEPDFRWRELADDLVAFARQLDVEQWITLGAITAALPHTRPVPILGLGTVSGGGAVATGKAAAAILHN